MCFIAGRRVFHLRRVDKGKRGREKKGRGHSELTEGQRGRKGSSWRGVKEWQIIWRTNYDDFVWLIWTCISAFLCSWYIKYSKYTSVNLLHGRQLDHTEVWNLTDPSWKSPISTFLINQFLYCNCKHSEIGLAAPSVFGWQKSETW